MSLSSILVLVEPEHGAAALEVAKHAAERLEAPVDAIAVRPDAREAVPLIGEGMSGDLVAQIIASSEAAAEAKMKATKALYEVAGLGASATFDIETGIESAVVARLGRMHGLNVLPCGPLSDSGSDVIAAALFDAGRPALIAPLHKIESLGKRIAIFWKDSPEAARAVWSAFPFFAEAEQIKAFTVGDDAADELSLNRLKDALGRAGVEVEAEFIAPKRATDGDQLIDAAAEMNADLIVMGAYSHSRLREFVFGGVTQTMLEALARPVFMAH